MLDPNTTESSDYVILANTCSTGTTVPVGGTCTLRVVFIPLTTGQHPTSILLASNAASSPDSIPVTGNGTGGVAAVGPADPADGFPQWYRDENGVTLAQCVDPHDANCALAPDEFFDPTKPQVFPTNFPGEFFYQNAGSDVLTTPGCNGGPTGRAKMTLGMEGSFINGAPAAHEQITFGRVRITVQGGLCPNASYDFVGPYGTTTLTTNAGGGIARNRGTDDVGCTPVVPNTCDFTIALQSRIAAGFLRWDPAVAPPAPAGYIGDGVTLHKVVGAPYSPDGITPANYFQINDATGTQVAKTSVFSVIGKLRGPLEADPATGDLGVVALGNTSPTSTMNLKNTGIAPLTISTLAVTGVDAADFTATTTACAGTVLAPGASCAIQLSFSPTATGDRTAGLVVNHTGLNNPFSVPLVGTGGAAGTTAAISFNPRSVAFTPLHVGRTSKIWTVSISNAGGTLPLDVQALSLTGTGAAQFGIVANRCTANVAPGAGCQVDLAFSPNAAGNFSAGLQVVDNAPGGRHTLALTGTGSSANPAVSPTVRDSDHFPKYYQDSTGTRIEPCLDVSDPNCVVLGDQFYNTNQPLSFPGNYPGEWFYQVVDSQAVSTPGCGGTAPGTASVRMSLEGAFANGTPVDGDQITFTRMRVFVTSGLCPNTPYTFETPYGTLTRTTNAAGQITRNASVIAGGTVDTGCAPVAPATCDFSQALLPDTSAAGIKPNGDTDALSYLRWDPADASAPANYLGDARAFHKVVGGTYVAAGDSQPVDKFAIFDSAGNNVGQTDTFTVSGKLAGPLQTDVSSVDFGHQPAGQTSGSRTVTVTNVAATPTTVSAVALSGVNSGDFRVTGGTCAGATVAVDGTCTVTVAFAPAAAGTKNATLRITPTGTGPATLVALTGIADQAAAPVAQVTPGVLAYGNVASGQPSTLSTTVANTGQAPLVVGAPTLTGTNADAYSVTANTCTTVAPGANCTISVKYAPTALGSQVASLVIPHNAGTGSTTVSLTANGLGSSFTLTPNPVAFGTVNRNSTKSLTVSVKNVGTIVGQVSAASITGTNAAAFTVTGAGCLGTSLAANRSCNLTVTFRPTLAQAYSANLVVTGDLTTVPKTTQEALTGTGK